MRRQQQGKPHPPLTDYSAAVARAIAWLGDRYLLAQPVNAVRHRPVPYCLYSFAGDDEERHIANNTVTSP